MEAWKGLSGFLEWLPVADRTAGFYDNVITTTDWRVSRPFFQVGGVAGGLKQFFQVAGSRLQRRVEAGTGAKPVFAAAGIPGTVGAGSKAIWRELAPLLLPSRAFGIWPFDGNLGEILAQHPVVLAEIYPRACYGLALGSGIPCTPIAIKKTNGAHRRSALCMLSTAHWVKDLAVTIMDGDWAEDNEDDFDALVSAAALLRLCVTRPDLLDGPDSLGSSPEVEGGILGRSGVTFRAKNERCARRGSLEKEASA